MKRHYITLVITLCLLALVFGTIGYASGFIYQHRVGIKNALGELASVVMTSVRVVLPHAATPTSTVTSTVPAVPLKPIGTLKTYASKKYNFSFSYPADYAPFTETGLQARTGCTLRVLFHLKQYVDETKNVLKPEPSSVGGARFSFCLTTPTTTLDKKSGNPYPTIAAYAQSRGNWLKISTSTSENITIGGFQALESKPTGPDAVRFAVIRIKPDRYLEVYDGLNDYDKDFLDIFRDSFKFGS
ncbi:MAG TPA: hypothetical protein VMC43_02985 [Candidatus Paceibacterota bacterium]|nr:hypothetical protein [Candidatus Paceibacterota bacterium]